MEERRIYCDQCKQQTHTSIQVEHLHSHSRDARLDFCDRYCLIKYFEANPVKWGQLISPTHHERG